ncbi:aminoacyl-tRNA hydrolase [Myxococcota bacterium]|nr:aminoacyl-tRNA hydrolase [Myxococcota bacterium]
MWLIVGLGNPEEEYRGTRHNVGFEVADALAERASTGISDRKFKARVGRGRLQGTDCVLLKPQTYMNLSGESVGPALGFYKLTTSDLIVIHDDLDIEVGRLKLKQGGGHGGHNGLRSLVEHLPDPNFARVRVGIGRPPPRWDPADYVLSRFQGGDRKLVDDAVQEAANAIEAIIRDGLRRAMNVYNRAPGSPDKEAD